MARRFIKARPQIGWPYPIGSGEYFGRGSADVRYGLPAPPVDATQAFMSARPLGGFLKTRKFAARLVAH